MSRGEVSSQARRKLKRAIGRLVKARNRYHEAVTSRLPEWDRPQGMPLSALARRGRVYVNTEERIGYNTYLLPSDARRLAGEILAAADKAEADGAPEKESLTERFLEEADFTDRRADLVNSATEGLQT